MEHTNEVSALSTVLQGPNARHVEASTKPITDHDAHCQDITYLTIDSVVRHPRSIWSSSWDVQDVDMTR